MLRIQISAQSELDYNAGLSYYSVP